MARRRQVYKNNDAGIAMAAWRTTFLWGDLDCHRENEDIDIGGRLWKSCLATGFQRPPLKKYCCKFVLASYVLDFLRTSSEHPISGVLDLVADILGYIAIHRCSQAGDGGTGTNEVCICNMKFNFMKYWMAILSYPFPYYRYGHGFWWP